MIRWKLLAIFCAIASFLPGQGGSMRPDQLLATARAQGVQAHGFYISLQRSLPTAQAQATVRLFEKEYQENQNAQVVMRTEDQITHLSLAVFVPADAAMANGVLRRMENLLGSHEDIAVCLTGRLPDGQLMQQGTALLSAAGEHPLGALEQEGLVSLSGEQAQVALRRDGNGTQVFFATPFIDMDY